MHRRAPKRLGRGRPPRRLAALALAAASSGCAGAPGAGPTPPSATEAEWRALAVARPAPLPGAARVSIAEVQLLGALSWAGGAPVGAELGLTALVEAGLLRRQDVRFVERRRFTAAAAAERDGVRRAPGAPPAGVSPGAELIATAVWIPLGDAGGQVEIRLAAAPTGAIESTTRVAVEGPDPVSVARAAVAGVVQALDEVGRRPTWADPAASADGTSRGVRVSGQALQDFLRGFAAEETWSWEEARRAYQAALAEGPFPEASAALARTARLRLGGTLGES